MSEGRPQTEAGKRLLAMAYTFDPDMTGRSIFISAEFLAVQLSDIEAEAAQRALADVRRAVDVDRLARAMVADHQSSKNHGNCTWSDDHHWYAEQVAAEYERLALLDTPPDDSLDAAWAAVNDPTGGDPRRYMAMVAAEDAREGAYVRELLAALTEEPDVRALPDALRALAARLDTPPEAQGGVDRSSYARPEVRDQP